MGVELIIYFLLIFFFSTLFVYFENNNKNYILSTKASHARQFKESIGMSVLL